MADLVTKLKLDDKDFNNKIEKSKKELNNFQQVQGALTSVLGKFAAGIGVAGGAMEAFNKMMENSVNFSDTMNKHIDGVKGTVDEFFYSLGTGDFSAFYAGIDGIIKRAANAEQALRNLQRASMSYSYLRSENRRNIATAKVTANNTELSGTQREACFSSWEKALSKMEGEANKYSQKAIAAVQKQVAKGNTLIAETITKREIEQVIKLNLDDDEVKQTYKNAYNHVERLIEDINSKYNVKQAGTNNKSINDSLAKQKENEIKAVQNKYRTVVIANEMLNKMSTEEFQSVVNMLNESNDIIEELGGQREEYNNTYKSFKEELKKAATANTSTKVNVKPVIPSNSLADIQQQINKLQASIQLAVDPATRANLYKEIETLESTKRTIEFEYKFPDRPTNLDANPVGSITTSTDISNIKLPTFSNIIDKKDVDLNYSYADSLNAIASVMGSVSNMTNEGAAAWITWGANVVTAIASALPSISTLVAAKTAEAGANAAASATAIPLVGWLMAGAAVASVLAAVATLPKFEEGGIFQSPLKSGDLNLARLNGGEMILNTTQQANLFSLLDGKGLNGSSNGEVRFKIAGKELVGVLNNYNNKISKVR